MQQWASFHSGDLQARESKGCLLLLAKHDTISTCDVNNKSNTNTSNNNSNSLDGSNGNGDNNKDGMSYVKLVYNLSAREYPTLTGQDRGDDQ